MQARQTDAKQSVEGKLLKTKVVKARLALEKSSLLTRIKEATRTLDSMTKPQGCIRSQQLQLNHKGSCAVVKSTPKQSIFRRTWAPMYPRPLPTYSHTASFSAEDILPHFLRKEHQSSASGPDASCNMSIADVSLVRDAVACHKTQVLADLGAAPTDTVWFMLFPREARPGLWLSHSSTLGSTACVLSSALTWFSCEFEAACLRSMEDNLRAAQSLSTSGWHTTLEQRSEIDCPLSTDPKLPGGSCSAVQYSEQGVAKVPDAPLHVPTPQLQLLGRYGLMCGENQRVPILEAVPNVLCHLLLLYHQQLPTAEWQRICWQLMHQMHRAVANLHPSPAGYDIAQHEYGAWSDGEWPDECPWAHLQEVAGEMIKLLACTVNDVYCQSFENAMLQSDAAGVSEAVMCHERVVQSAQQICCGKAIFTSMILTDAPATYRTVLGNNPDLLHRSPLVRSCMYPFVPVTVLGHSATVKPFVPHPQY